MAQWHKKFWKSMDTGEMPYWPVVTAGWDCSPRWVKNVAFPPGANGYPYTPIVVNGSPERFGNLAADAVAYVKSAKLRPAAIRVNAWTEWTEGSVLLPTTKYGTAYLDALTSAIRTAGNP